jgi:Zn-dependent protease
MRFGRVGRRISSTPSFVIDQLYIIPILLFSIIIHEMAHGWMALRLGDTTALDAGRLTLNPIPHIDPIGSIIVPLIAMLSPGHFFIAWAKPVPVNPMNFSNYKRDDILVSVVGPLSNLLLALACSIAFIILNFLGGVMVTRQPVLADGFSFLMNMFGGGITLNIVLAVFNMIPIPPLDGSHVLANYLPPHLREPYQRIGFFGIIIIILLMSLQPFNMIFQEIISVIRLPYEILIRMFV